MINQELKVRTLSPVWTGDAEGVPQGLKCSGVIGSMRMIFEALIRGEAGGHTCNITGTQGDQRCNYSKDPNICPACAIFGCTGLSRAFKINWELPEIKNILMPIADTEDDYTNRAHDERKYKQKNGREETPIASWLAKTVSANKEMVENSPEKVWIEKVRPAYSAEVSTIQIIQIRHVEKQGIPIDVPGLIRELLAFMAVKYGIGAKVNQGWGAFAVADEHPSGFDHLKEEVRKLIELYRYSKTFDTDLLNASQIGVYRYSFDKDPSKVIPFRLSRKNNGLVDNFDFSWPSDPSVGQNFICLGYALKYRLRRMVKFADSKSKIGELAAAWAQSNQRLVSQYKNVLWKKQGAFAEYLFGAAAKTDNDQYGAGIIGVSHLYRFDKNQDWSVRLLTQCPNDDYNKAILQLFLTIRKQAKGELL